MLFRLADQQHLSHWKYLPDDLTFAEVQERAAYERQYGLRHDLQWGFLTQVSANAFGGTAELSQCMPYQIDPEPEPEEVFQKLLKRFPRLAPK